MKERYKEAVFVRDDPLGRMEGHEVREGAIEIESKQ